MVDGGTHHVFGAEHIGADRFHRIELARRYLLQRRGVEHIVHALDGVVHAVVLPHIADVELDLVVLQRDAHVFLLLLVPAEDADLGEVRMQKALQYSVAE